MIYYKVSELLAQRAEVPLIDVRTPAEFLAGHIPGAVNVPLFTDEERAVVGTLYVKRGKEEAVEKGLEYVGPKMAGFVRQAKKLAGEEKRVNLYCWRGGMRSGSMGWLFETAGMKVGILTGGYKSYRTFIREDFARPLRLIVLGGMTGSGKTDILHELALQGEQVLDLEGLAHHKGSAFGALGQQEQPSNEMFENETWEVWGGFVPERPVWTEDESMAIGSVWINEVLYGKMREAQTFNLQLPFEVRVERLLKEYGSFDPQKLMALIRRLERRLGGDKVAKACEGLEKGDIRGAVEIVLHYYDKAYAYGLEQKKCLILIESSIGDPLANATLVQQYLNT